MAETELDKLLSQGLEAGYAGGTERQTVTRGPFTIEASQFTSPNNGIYIDQWIADRTGGGQEIVKEGNQTRTRLYAGGTIGIENLRQLGLTKKDVIGYLKRKIKELGGKTRLFEDCNTDPDGDWQYTYHIMQTMGDIPLTVGMETISFKGTRIFAHGFLHTTVE